ncbi:MAG: hypothetical protein QNJ92_16285 [Alphaproteobacteria bacterium]|nr:hypothetical protein [Alphaproteobacteria bacterium]
MAETSKPKTPKPKSRSARRAETGHDRAPGGDASDALQPLDYLLQVMRDGAETPSRRMEAAKAAAPFVHPRRATVEHAGGVTVSHEDALDALD